MASNLLSKFKKLILIIPISWSEKIIIKIPAKILNISEFCKRICPRKDADAPRIIKTVEKPKQNKTNGKKFILLVSKTSFSDCPDIKEIYPGIMGKTHGDKKLISPAPNAINISII